MVSKSFCWPTVELPCKAALKILFNCLINFALAFAAALPVCLQIRFLLLQNRQGKTRLSKWYIPLYDEQEKNKIENDVHRLVVSRDRKYTNFIEYQVSVSR
jgi:Clathrin adaptor complex small chain